ncbi:MAG: hypothetical protein EP301_07860, partial [Gammaproteobacteria bacterium]
GQFDDADTHVLSLDAGTGAIVWESPRLAGRAMQGVVTDDSSTLYLSAVSGAHGSDKGFLSSPISGKGFGAGVYRDPRILSLDLDSGEILWEVKFDREVRLQHADGVRVGDEQPYDLGVYHRPFVVDRMLCVTYSGVRCLNRFTGATVWDQTFSVVEDDLARAYAPPVILGGTLFATGANRIYAFDLRSGERLWRSKKANVLAEIQVDEATVYSQLGGRFYHLGRERWVWKGEFGVMAVDRQTGKTRWRFDDAKGAISNLHYESDRIWFADTHRLYALDRRTGKKVLRAKHRMKSAPSFLVLNSRGHFVLVADDEVAAFDRRGVRLWSEHHPAPAPGAWQKASAQLFQVSGSLLRIASMAVSVAGGLLPAMPTVAGVTVVSSKSIARTATSSAGNQLSAAGEAMVAEDDYEELLNAYQYFLTADSQGHEDEVEIYLAAVDINSGETVRLTPLPAASPQIVIDDARGTLIQASGDTLTSLPIR